MRVLPKYKIGGHVFTTEKVCTEDLKKGRENFARVDIVGKVIYLDNTLPQSHLENSLIHELLHCAMAETGLARDFAEGRPLKEEDIVERLSNCLFSIFTNNDMLK